MKSIGELIEAHEKGIIPEALLFRNLLAWIPQKSIDEILGVLTETQRHRFKMTLVSVAHPGFVFLEGDTLPEETLIPIREYVRQRLGTSSVTWK